MARLTSQPTVAGWLVTGPAPRLVRPAAPTTTGRPEAVMHREWPGLRVEVYWASGEALVVVHGDLDGVSAVDLAERLVEVGSVLRFLNGQPQRLVVDLADVQFVNLAAARALDAARHQLPPECPLVLRSSGRAARKILASAGLLDLDVAVTDPASRAAGNGGASRMWARRKAPRA
jgi:anti-anti-sigma regulatory factor